jgi:hypothetical protein
VPKINQKLGYVEATKVRSNETAENPLTAAIRKLDHISGSAWPAAELRERILKYCDTHGGVDDWHDFIDVCKTTFAWTQFGKRLVDCLIPLMVGAGEIEVDALPVPGMIRRVASSPDPDQLRFFDKPVPAVVDDKWLAVATAKMPKAAAANQIKASAVGSGPYASLGCRVKEVRPAVLFPTAEARDRSLKVRCAADCRLDHLALELN